MSFLEYDRKLRRCLGEWFYCYDTVAEEVHEAQASAVSAVEDARDQILVKIDSNGSLFSIDRAVALAEAGSLDSIGSGIKKMLDHISLEHPYYPHFGYDYRNGMILSKPLAAEAKKLYPIKYVLTGAVRFGDQYYNDANGDPLDYAYRHQLPITMEVSKATKLLGESLIPGRMKWLFLKAILWLPRHQHFRRHSLAP